MSAARELAEIALDVAERRAEVLRRMRAALMRDDTPEVVRCARILTGLENHEASDRTPARQH